VKGLEGEDEEAKRNEPTLQHKKKPSSVSCFANSCYDNKRLKNTN